MLLLLMLMLSMMAGLLLLAGLLLAGLLLLAGVGRWETGGSDSRSCDGSTHCDRPAVFAWMFPPW